MMIKHIKNVVLIMGLLSACMLTPIQAKTVQLSTANKSILSINNPIQGAFSNMLDIPINVVPGDYVEGRIIITQGDINLGLRESSATQIDKSKKLTKMRLLIESLSADGEFRFVATESTLGLRLLSKDGGKATIGYEISLTKHIPLAEQTPPTRKYLSKNIATLASLVSKGESIETAWLNMTDKGTPFIEAVTPKDALTQATKAELVLLKKDVVMTFVYRGAKRNVRLYGSPSSEHEYLENLTGTDIWFKSFIVPPTTRLAYKFSPDIPEFNGSTWERRVALLATAQADPLNKSPWPQSKFDTNASPFNYESSVSMVDLPNNIYLKQSNVTAGKLIKHRFSSKLLGNERNIWLYTSANFNEKNSDTILLLQFDGKKFITKVPVPIILDNLTHQDKLPPVAAVFIDNPTSESRFKELPDNPIFAQALAEEILPWVKEKLNTTINAQNTVVAGSSFGGLASSSVALRYPQCSGNVLSMSGSYWWSPKGTAPENEEHTANWIASNEHQPVKFFLSAGLFERSLRGSIGLLETNRHLKTVLKAKGYQVTYKEFAGGHDSFSWQEAFTEGMLSLFGHH